MRLLVFDDDAFEPFGLLHLVFLFNAFDFDNYYVRVFIGPVVPSKRNLFAFWRKDQDFIVLALVVLVLLFIRRLLLLNGDLVLRFVL